ncbi:hypothetical protein [Desertivirga brevis]|nr:hypothetical protein [Pedobacter sp. SYSU D00873]
MEAFLDVVFGIFSGGNWFKKRGTYKPVHIAFGIVYLLFIVWIALDV